MLELFITGTDTGVGKTHVSAALLRAARARGKSTLAFKPVESGYSGRDSDAARLQHAAGAAQSLTEVCPNPLAMVAAPLVAARDVSTRLDVSLMARQAETLREQRPDVLLIEGAGGLLVPLTETETVAELARAIGAPLLLVARDGLGTINHCALTVEAARQRGLCIAGVVLNAAQDATSPARVDSNATEIERMTGVRVLARFVRGQNDAAELFDRLEALFADAKLGEQ